MLLCLVCGLPGAGKSTLLRYIEGQSSIQPDANPLPGNVVSIHFDDVQLWLQHRNTTSTTSTTPAPFSPELWHLAQRTFLAVVASLCGVTSTSTSTPDTADLPAEYIASRSLSRPSGTLFVEDNFYFSSMRARFKRIAAELQLPFVCVWVHADQEICCARNAGRCEEEKVGEGVIERMGLVAEVAGVVVVENGGDGGVGGVVERLWEVCAEAVEAPPPVDEVQRDAERTERADAARNVTQQNRVHQLDKALRAAVATLMSATSHLPSQTKRTLGSHIAKLRQSALAEGKQKADIHIQEIVDTFYTASYGALARY